jgi:hypothetical protein
LSTIASAVHAQIAHTQKTIASAVHAQIAHTQKALHDVKNA